MGRQQAARGALRHRAPTDRNGADAGRTGDQTLPMRSGLRRSDRAIRMSAPAGTLEEEGEARPCSTRPKSAALEGRVGRSGMAHEGDVHLLHWHLPRGAREPAGTVSEPLPCVAGLERELRPVAAGKLRMSWSHRNLLQSNSSISAGSDMREGIAAGEQLQSGGELVCLLLSVSRLRRSIGATS